MLGLRRLLTRRRATQDSSFDTGSNMRTSGLRTGLAGDYEALIRTSFERWGLVTACLQVKVRSIGRRPDGFEVFAAGVTLRTWNRDTALRLLLGLPLVDARIRKIAQATWLADYSHFAGLWVHASSELAVPGELKEWLRTLHGASDSSTGRMTDSNFSDFRS